MKNTPTSRSTRSLRRTLKPLAGSIAALLLGAASTHAGIVIWNGLGANANWSTNGNWNTNTAPVNNDDLQFAGTNQLGNTNNLNLSGISIAFNPSAGAFTLNGNFATLNGNGIVNNSANLQTISLTAFTLEGNQTWNAATEDLVVNSWINLGGVSLVGNTLTITGANDTFLNGVISQTPVQSGAGITKNGTGTLTITGDNTYGAGSAVTGVTQLNAGKLVLGHDNALGVSDFTINGGTVSGLGYGNRTIANLVYVNSDFSVEPDTNSTFVFSGPVNLMAGNRTITNSSNATLPDFAIVEFSGVISNGTGLTLLSPGNGNFRLSGSASNTYTGLTTVGDGANYAQLFLAKTGTAAAVAGNLSVLNGNVDLETVNPNLIAGNAITLQTGTISDKAGNTLSSAKTITLIDTNGLGASSGVTFTVDSKITGAGRLDIGSDGTLVLSNSSSDYTGGTNLYYGTLIINASSTPNDGSDVATGPLGTGRLLITGGTVGSTTVNNLRLGNDLQVEGDFSVAARTTGSGRTVRFNGDTDLLDGVRAITNTTANSIVHFGGAISNGGVTFNSVSGISGFLYDDTFDIARPNTYTGLTTINENAFLALQKGGLNNAIQGDVLVNAGGSFGLVNFYPDQIADTSTVTVLSAGLAPTMLIPYRTAGFDLNGNNETIGALFGNGTVQLNDYGIDGTGGASLAGILTVGAGNFSGSISDAGLGGQLVKVGPSTLVLSGNNTYVGNTTINGGSLIVNGATASANTFVNPGALLGGSGFVGGNVINRGVVSPGNSPGTLTVKGNYSQAGNGTLYTEVAGKAPGQYDTLAVGGNAGLDGTVRIVNVGSVRLKRGDKLAIVTANGGVSGKFANEQVDSFGTENTILSTEVVYDSNAVYLAAVQGSFDSLDGLTPNQKTIARNLDRVTSNPNANALIDYLDELPLSKLPHAFDLIAPEEMQAVFSIGMSQANVQTANLTRRMDNVQGGTAGFDAAGLAMNGLEPQYASNYLAPRQGLAGPEGKMGKEIRPPAEPTRLGVFITGYGEWASIDGTTNASGYNLATGGFTLGVDYRVTENFAIGINAGYARTSADLVDNGNISVDGAKFGLYGTYFTGGFHIDAAVQGGYSSYDTRRSALQGSARGSTNGGEINTLFNVGYDWKSGGLTAGAFANFQYTNVGFDGFSEHGSPAPLRFSDQSAESIRTALGAKVAYEFHLGTVVLKPEVRAAWQHEFGDSAYGIDARFRSAGGNSFTVQGAEIGEDSMLLGAGFAIFWNERTSTYVYYDGELFRSNFESNNVSGGVRMSF